ncbi:hypothetical protein BOTBODRAFT_47496 [Botryobasidium botryosum FD-172 SS1]|uniref:Uncharacterized protein n=1 Tax=Botryobasidium botryosum (strain FD-172 SS1) TaxID=930990 RepID=A0A067MDH7_BOTB1|nr:hypothetical protein BOTBODRAFT_47496 [Botryobasidium botryosum FD-172 SS1]
MYWTVAQRCLMDEALKEMAGKTRDQEGFRLVMGTYHLAAQDESHCPRHQFLQYGLTSMDEDWKERAVVAPRGQEGAQLVLQAEEVFGMKREASSIGSPGGSIACWAPGVVLMEPLCLVPVFDVGGGDGASSVDGASSGDCASGSGYLLTLNC